MDHHQKKKIDLDCDSEEEEVSDELPPQHTKYPWLVAQLIDYDEMKAQEQIFYNIHNPLSQYRCRIPELTGKRIQACFHGWVVLCEYREYSFYENDHIMWSLWNPQTTCKIIQLPPLRFRRTYIGEYECCLPFPPDDPNSIFLVTTCLQSKFIYCRLNPKKGKKLTWTKMSYHKKLTSITGINHCYLNCPTVSNDKIYFLSSSRRRYKQPRAATPGCECFVIHVDISVRGKMYAFNLIPLVKQPVRPSIISDNLPGVGYFNSYSFLKGSSDDLFFIYLYEKKQEIYSVYLFKLNMGSMLWEKLENLKDNVLFIDGSAINRFGIFSPAIPVPSSRGGYIHILHHWGQQVIKSYHVRNRTIITMYTPHESHTAPSWWLYALWSMPGCGGGGLQRKRGECSVESSSKRQVEEDDDENESCEFSFPFHILEMILKFCVDVDYLKFRATCKQFAAALPVIRWSNITEILVTLNKTYSLLQHTPWSMILDRDRGIIIIIDLMLGNKYFIKTSQELVGGDVEIHSSGYGWLLMSKNATTDVMFFNPFTSDIRKLPHQDFCHFENLCFSAPPTSPNCMVVGFAVDEWFVFIHFVNREQSWRQLILPIDNFSAMPDVSSFLTFYGRDIYSLSANQLKVFKWDEDDYLFKTDNHNLLGCWYIPRMYYLTKSDQHLLLVYVLESETSVTVYKFNQSLMEWESLDSLGKYAIFISETTCLCIEARIPKMENKIYFDESYSENGKILFYSLETHMFHTIEDDNMKGSFNDLYKPKQLLLPHTWIEPSCL